MAEKKLDPKKIGFGFETIVIMGGKLGKILRIAIDMISRKSFNELPEQYQKDIKEIRDTARDITPPTEEEK